MIKAQMRRYANLQVCILKVRFFIIVEHLRGKWIVLVPIKYYTSMIYNI